MSPLPLPRRTDVVVVGAGHNGLVAATLLARAGLDVLVLEAADTVGGAARTEYPFPRVPQLGQSTGAYLLGLMPPELIWLLGVDLPLIRRDPHYFLPTDRPGRYLWLGRTRDTTDLVSAADARADAALQAELAALREDLAPAWLAEPLPVEQTAERYVRPQLRQAFQDLVTGSVTGYLDRFGFTGELLPALYAVTDGLSGLAAGPDDPGTGHNLLVHNMCRLPGGDGTWLVVRGGMGTVSDRLAGAARAAGATLVAGSPVVEVCLSAGAVDGVALADGRQVRAPVVLGGCDPFRLAGLVGWDRLPTGLAHRLDGLRRPGSTLKVNLALRDLPRFTCLPDGAAHPGAATVHLLPDATGHPLAALRQMWAQVAARGLPEEPTIEWYVHTGADPSLQDPAGHHSSALFVQSVPHTPAGTTWAEALPAYVEHLLGLCDRVAPGTAPLVADVLPLTPPGIEARFGITGGHIHHVDNAVTFTDRVPYGFGVPGLYAGSAGCHPAGSVIGAAGHNAAARILADLGLPPPRRP